MSNAHRKPNKSYQKRSSRILANLNLRFIAKQQCGAPRSISIVKQQEVKRDWLEEGEEIRIDFVFCEAKESRTFQASKRRRRPYLPTYSAQIAFPQRHTFCAYIYDLGRGCTFFLHILHIYNRYLYIKYGFL